MDKIVPNLWFNNQAEEAVEFYTSIFDNSKTISKSYYGEAAAKAAGMPKGSVLTITFQLAGRDFTALNGGPQFKFNETISLLVNCETQEEVDELWEKLTDGGEEVQCGWLKDKYGLSWQIVPKVLDEMLRDEDTEKSERVMKACCI